ncbi:hypothetical protein [Bacillus sp. CHD6a]|uniref:hypothetical protein n=1 Tax=Bacillus sp. CHD6a TaxID=1643452 RepID=UPI0006CDCDB0|nr:hypothetical protein [Bacillus sp. CHD6a]KPB06321.1 hypothetical protein AAV98_00505 [Bacillus sp. CHD6a]
MTVAKLKEYIDRETGELVRGNLLEEGFEGKVITQESQDKILKYHAEKKQYDNYKDIAGGFTFMLIDTLKAFNEDISFTDMEKARIMFLGSYVSYESHGRYLITNNNKCILKSDLQELLEIKGKKEFYNLYNKMVEAGIIEEEVKSRYEIRLKWNSSYHFKGTLKGAGVSSADTVKTYDRQIQELYKAKGKNGKSINTPKNLYIMFMMLPFLHIESSALCKYPNNPIEEGSEPLQLNELAKMFGYKPSAFRTLLLKCTLFKTNVFLISEGIDAGERYTRIFVNPFVASRSHKAPNPSLLAMFPNIGEAIVKNIMDKKK